VGTYTVTATPAADKFFGFNFAPIADSAHPPLTSVPYLDGTTRIARIETDRMRVDCDLQTGGAVTGLYEKINGVWTSNFVNNYDKGRQLILGFWSGPYPFNPPGYEKPPPPHPFNNMQWNPNESGNWVVPGQGSRILNYGHDSGTQTQYMKTRLRNFPTRDYETGLILERWRRPVASNIVRCWFKASWDRSIEAVPDLSRWPADPTGETPTLYGNP
jgi:hypothetical protein